jgi:hypothetical protein
MEAKVPFIAGAPVSGSLFIDRDDVLSRFEDVVSSGFGNVLLVGQRRIGKTSVCLRFLELSTKMPNLLGSYMSMEANYERSSDEFTQAVLLNVLARMAKEFFNKKYSDLLQDLGRAKSPTGKYRRFLRLFELARGGSWKLGASSKRDVGVSAVARAQLSETEHAEMSISPLSSFEFLALLEEAVEMLRDGEIHRYILFVDEANKLTLESNARIIRENLSLFSAKGLQFCFVTTPEVVAVAPEARDLFQTCIELGPFARREHLNCLVEIYSSLLCGCAVSFTSAALDVIWKLSQGFPYRLQFLCRQSLVKAHERGSNRVEVPDTLAAMQDQGPW